MKMLIRVIEKMKILKTNSVTCIFIAVFDSIIQILVSNLKKSGKLEEKTGACALVKSKNACFDVQNKINISFCSPF
jgi:hypothetical protein